MASWKCSISSCSYTNSMENFLCANCGQSWSCLTCTMVNSVSANKCRVCETPNEYLQILQQSKPPKYSNIPSHPKSNNSSRNKKKSNKKACPICTYEQSDKNKNCQICDAPLTTLTASNTYQSTSKPRAPRITPNAGHRQDEYRSKTLTTLYDEEDSKHNQYNAHNPHTSSSNNQNANEDTNSTKKSDMATSRLRYGYGQVKYRQDSRSAYKDSKDAAHYVSLELANAISGHIPGKEPTEKIRYALSNNNNLRMVERDVNRLKSRRDGHKKIDEKLIKIINGDNSVSTQLNYHESRRAKMQAKKIMENNELPLSFRMEAKKHYSKMTDHKGNKIWDQRHESGDMRQQRLETNKIYNNNDYNNDDFNDPKHYNFHNKDDDDELVRELERFEMVREQERKMKDRKDKEEMERNRIENERLKAIQKKYNESNGASLNEYMASMRNMGDTRGNIGNIDDIGNGVSNSIDNINGDIYKSNGKANGKQLFTGPRGGKYYITESGKKRYV